MQPRVFNPISDLQNIISLKTFCDACNEYSKENRGHFKVSMQECYFDFGQDWRYTALITTNETNGNHWQSVCPRDWELIATTKNIDTLIDMAWYYMDSITNGEICVYLYKRF